MTYDDGAIALDEAGLTVRDYFLPGRPRHIPFAAIVDAELIPLGFWTGRHQLMGIGPFRPRSFFPWDRKRATRSSGVSLDLGKRLRVVITPDDPDRVLELIRTGGALSSSPPQLG